ncbi:nucleophile aminohydrolase [Dendryphion nanum]|uniref:Nucleophile aminohydrolase n=1 Tax=Dendryphion nanum TaxID=256645 RepID=A0A9P9D815_9PLEO|nr:nucleophile aminohydrolase [Dendryphion nanum]
MSIPANQAIATDGAPHTSRPESMARKATESPYRQETCCIFVHAGAGYHSIQNERIHLEACNDAATMAMLVLRNGGTAVDGAEMAVRVLEDREITNAGYGSNLAMDGIVECDASIVDHLGRSGAVGAVAQIKNPVCLARLVLNHTMQMLTLRRVPPNLLVSQGATDFANEMGVPILPYDALVSPAAQERWVRWRADLRIAERKAKKLGSPPACWQIRSDSTPTEEQTRQRMREEHERNLLRGLGILERQSLPLSSDTNAAPEGLISQSNSLVPSGLVPEYASSQSWPCEETLPSAQPSLVSQAPAIVIAAPNTITESSRSAFINSTQTVPTISQLAKPQKASLEITSNNIPDDTGMRDTDLSRKRSGGDSLSRKSWGDGSEESDSTSSARTMQPLTPSSIAAASKITPPCTAIRGQVDHPIPLGSIPLSQVNAVKNYAALSPPHKNTSEPSLLKDDDITDTVGAIAVDGWGNIACAASSGGIGMKYRGRVGPAALVGVGAAVVPKDPADADETCVATVTSGTGEHMATTMAATVSAERLYRSERKMQGGGNESTTEDEALRSMIENEFMGTVKNSNSAGAIGVLGVKKMRDGVFLYFGHNTDSFAMASFHDDEARPLCVMSRGAGNGSIAQGGRMLRYKTKKKRTTGPTR